MKLRLITTILFLVFFQIVRSQEKLLAIRQHSTQGFSIYDKDGHILFKLPPKNDPAVRTEWEPYFLSDFYIIDFSTGTLPVKSENGFYVVNKKGETIKKVTGEYMFVSAIQNNFFYATSRIPDGSTVFEYFDAKGEPAFAGRKYWNGGEVIHGVALVQYYEDGVEPLLQNGDWVLMKNDGSEIKNVSSETKGKISRFCEIFPDQWNLTVEGEHSIYVSPEGTIQTQQIEGKDAIVNQMRNQIHIMDSIANAKNLSYKHDYYFWPNAFIQGKVFFIRDISDGAPKSILMDEEFNTIELKRDSNTVFPIEFKGDYVLTVERKDGKNISYPLFNVKTQTISAVLKEYPDDIEDGYILYYSDGSNKIFPKVDKVLNMKGVPIYELDISQRFVTDITEAMKNRDRIKMLRLKEPDPSKLASLGAFKNLEIFELQNYKMDQLPIEFFKNWSNVKIVEINSCDALISLPGSMKDLKLLEELTILSCDHLKGIEDWLAMWPTLKSIKTDLPISPETRKKYPNIKFVETLVEVKE